MLTIFNPARYTRLFYIADQTAVLFGDATGLLPFRLGNKPHATEPNSFGNTDVHHIQYHGQAFNYDTWLQIGGEIKPAGTRFVFDGWPRLDFAITAIDYVGRKSKINIRQLFVSDSGLYFPPMTYLETKPHYSLWGFWYNTDTPNDVFTCRLRLTSYYDTLTLELQGQYACYDPKQNLSTLDTSYWLPDTWMPSVESILPKFRSGGSGTTWYTWTYEGVERYDSEAKLRAIFTQKFERRVQFFLRFYNRDTRFANRGILYRMVHVPQVANMGVQRYFALKELFNADVEAYIARNPITTADYGDATEVAVQNCRNFTGNGVAYALEAFELVKTFKDLMRLLRGNVSPESLSNLWLSYRYGLRLTVRDTFDLLDGLRRELARRALEHDYAISRGRSGDCRCELYYEKEADDAVIGALRDLAVVDLLPNFTMLWDLIPFSFVVDWFVDVEGLTSALDTRTFSELYNVRSALYTSKRRVPVPVVWHGYTVMGYITVFDRFTSAPIMPALRLSGSQPSNKNILDGAALLISNL